MRIIFFGTPDFAVPSLNQIIESGEEVLLIVSQPDRLKGRGHKLSQPPVKEFAVSRGITVMQPQGIKSPAFAEELSKMRPDAIVVVAYGRIIPPAILNIPPLGCINVHASLLPKYRGAAPIQWAIINGENKTGITTMLMDEGLDTGDMLLQEEIDISDEDTAYTLSIRLSEAGAGLLVKTLAGLKNKSLQPVRQTGEPSYAPPLKKEDGNIKWSFTSEAISNLIRGTYPWPGANCYFNREKITIIKAKATDPDFRDKPGRIIKASDGELYVCTGKGILSILEVKPEGKKTMNASAFINGRHIKEGMYFDPA